MRTNVYRIALSALILVSACKHPPKIPPRPDTPVLAPVPSIYVGVQFVGTGYDPAALYVCGTYADKLSCVEYQYFMEQLQKQP